MTTPEHGTPGGAHKMGWIEKLKLVIAQIFSEKVRAEEETKRLKEEGEKAHRKRREYESREKRERELERKEQEDLQREYHKQRSGEMQEIQTNIAQSRRAQEVKDKLIRLRENEDAVPEGAKYIVDILSNPQMQQTIDRLLQNPNATETINRLISSGREVHGDAHELIRQAQKLAYEANGQNMLPDIELALGEIGRRTKELLSDELRVRQIAARREGKDGPRTFADLLADVEGISLEGAEDDLRYFDKDNPRETSNRWSRAIDNLTKTAKGDYNRADWVRSSRTSPNQVVASSISGPIDEVWADVERKEAAGLLTVDDLRRFDREIKEKRDKTIPRDVLPNTEGYKQALQSLNAYTEDKLNKLAERLKNRLLEETPRFTSGITDPEKFLKEIAESKGALGRLFKYNPDMEKLFYRLDEDGRKFRQKVFLRIHSPILSDRRNSSNENFGLYERADFTTFIDLLRIGFKDLTNKQTGESLGQAWADYFNNLSNAIRQSRDLDYWATQPAADVSSFTKSLGMFQNEYVEHAMMIPAVNAAFRAYEVSLRSIREANDGYLPAGYFEYSAPNMGSYWDQMSQRMLEEMITLKSIPDMKRDKDTGIHIVDKDGQTVIMDTENPLKWDDFKDNQDEVMMYMTLAKGIGLVSARFFEYFANARVPGSFHPETGMEGFHSQPYEQVARAMNYFSMVINKWRFGSYKYFYLFNSLLPADKQINFDGEGGEANAAKEAMLMYQAYQDGTFEEKYGSQEAKRLLDMMNFSKISSAIGQETTWRQLGSTSLWSDRMRELLGGPTRLVLSGKYAGDAVKRYLVEGKYREMYRAEIEKINREQGENLPTSGGGFDKLWKEYGEAKYKGQITREWDSLRGKSIKKISTEHTPMRHEFEEHYKDAFQKAFKTRVWMEMAMRNPLVVAHSLKIPIPSVGTEGVKKISLHRVLVQKILGITPEDLKWGDLYGEAKWDATPTKVQQDYLAAVLQLETDLATVRELAINNKTGFARDLTDDDFKIITDEARRKHTLEYWRTVRKLIAGNAAVNGEEIYDSIGMAVSDNDQDYDWDFEKIHGIEGKIDHIAEHGEKITFQGQDGRDIVIGNLLKQAVDMKTEWILGTDDMAFNRMDVLNLASRHWVRRGGDIAAHQAGGEKVAQFLVNGILPNPDKHELAKLFKEIRDAYSGDMIEAGWTVVGNMAYLTDKLYSWDWGLLGSPAQRNVWKTRRGVAAWMANGRREFWDAMEHADVLPPHGHFYFYDHINDEKTNIHNLRKLRHADNSDVWREIITLGLLIALAMTVYRALTAPSEEEEGGGGGGHH